MENVSHNTSFDEEDEGTPSQQQRNYYEEEDDDAITYTDRAAQQYLEE